MVCRREKDAVKSIAAGSIEARNPLLGHNT